METISREMDEIVEPFPTEKTPLPSMDEPLDVQKHYYFIHLKIYRHPDEARENQMMHEMQMVHDYMQMEYVRLGCNQEALNEKFGGMNIRLSELQDRMYGTRLPFHRHDYSAEPQHLIAIGNILTGIKAVIDEYYSEGVRSFVIRIIEEQGLEKEYRRRTTRAAELSALRQDYERRHPKKDNGDEHMSVVRIGMDC